MNRRAFLADAAALTAAISSRAYAAPSTNPAARPNVLVILGDDMGFSDLGCYGGEIRSPNLDRLARDGVRFRQCYNSARCCPSRASLLTGLYPHQAGVGRFVGPGAGLPGYQGHLTDRCVTLAEALRPAGYSTYAVGKWHVNLPGPLMRGFDEFYGYRFGYAVDSYNPRHMIRLPDGRPEPTYPPGRYYATTALTDQSIAFLRDARARRQPWLMYLAYQVAHFPLQAPAATIKRYLPVYEKGWDVLRAERLARMQKLGLMPADLALPPRSPIDDPTVARRIGSMTPDGLNPAWNSLPADRRADLAHRMATYAAMVETMDAGIGRIVSDLRRHGDLDNTLILFLSDNGACAEWEPFGFDLDATKFNNLPRGQGVDGATPDCPNHLHTGAELDAMGGPGSMFSYGCAWANLCNTPLRLYKHYAHEGGIRTPLIASWPAARLAPGWRAQVAHVSDIMATCVDVAGAEYPMEFKGHAILPLEGRSLTPALCGEPAVERTLIFEHEGNAALRQGDWKMVGLHVLGKEGLREGGRWELYNLSADPAEQRDLAGSEPERVAKMAATFLAEARRTLALPAP